jgi:hypothetical protein
MRRGLRNQNLSKSNRDFGACKIINTLRFGLRLQTTVERELMVAIIMTGIPIRQAVANSP